MGPQQMDALGMSDLTPYFPGPRLVVLALAICVYCLPTAIVMFRKRSDDGYLFGFNLLWGWSSFGWLAALGWALVGERD